MKTAWVFVVFGFVSVVALCEQKQPPIAREPKLTEDQKKALAKKHAELEKLLDDIDKATATRIAELYPPVPFAKVADGKWKRARASIVGTVKEVRKESDGDWHIALVDGGKLVVCEIIPELHVAPPKKSDRIKAWGIVREDGWHGWWELHPLVGWEAVK